jgi:photoactive yellow protein
MTDTLLLQFHQSAPTEIADLSDTDLDTPDFGVIGFDTDTVARRCNAFESKLAGLAPTRELGHPLFTAIAPCMNIFLIAQRFENAAAGGTALDATVDYVFTLRMRPVKVKLRLVAAPGAKLRYVLVSRPP